MTNKGVDRETANLSEATTEVRRRELAVYDWSKMPSAEIKKLMDPISWQTLSNYRESQEYKETLEELRAEWREQVSRIPGSNELRSKIQYGMTLSIDRLIEILVPQGKAAYKDRISAARLMAQLDGRFLHEADAEEGKETRNVESVAQELLGALNKPRVN